MSADTTTTDPAATGTQGDGAPASQTPTGKTFTQEEVSRLVAREVGKVKASLDPITREREELSQRLAALEAERQQEAESRMNATQRAELAQKREREAWEKKIADLSTQATRERSRRHELLVRAEATQAIARVAPKLFSSEIAPDLVALISQRLTVVDDGAGGESVHIRTGSTPAETEPLTPEAWAAFESSTLARYYRAEGGAGARHGGGAGNGRVSVEEMRRLPATERIAAGLAGKR